MDSDKINFWGQMMLLMAIPIAGLASHAIGEMPPTADLGQVPGVVIAHAPATSGVYIGSPAITIVDRQTYLASHDEFGPNGQARTHVYRSADRGRTWKQLATVDGVYWASLFCHRQAVYLMGTTAAHRRGHVVIRRSTDGGRTWSRAVDGKTGLLTTDLSYHTAPVPVVVHEGRIWRAMEDEKGGGGWPRMFRAFMMSAPVDADLLRADNWTRTNVLGHQPEYLDGHFGGWLEGNAVVGPNGQMVNVLRVHDPRVPEKAAIIRISSDGRRATFDPTEDFVTLPGGCKKFVIRHDPRSNRYWTLTNAVLPAHRGRPAGQIRNAVVLLSSSDLRQWHAHTVLLYSSHAGRHGFQYLDWLIDGDDIIAAARTAYDDGLGGAERAHDANLLTFHRFKDFRTLTITDSVVPWDKAAMAAVGLHPPSFTATEASGPGKQ